MNRHFDDGLAVPLAHVLDHHESRFDDGGYHAETSYHPGVCRLIPDAGGTDGPVTLGGRCSVCGNAVGFAAEQQVMLYVEAEDAARLAASIHGAFRPRLAHLAFGPGLMGVGAGLALAMLVALYWLPPPESGLDAPMHPETALSMAILGLVLAVAGYFYRHAVRGDVLGSGERRRLAAGDAAFLVSQQLAAANGFDPGPAARRVAVIRRLGLSPGEQGHFMRLGEGGSWTHVGIFTDVTTEIQGEVLGRGTEEITPPEAPDVIEIGRRMHPVAAPEAMDPRRPPPVRIGSLLGAFALAALFSVPLPFLGTLLHEIGSSAPQPGAIAAWARSVGIWDTFAILFVATFPMALIWLLAPEDPAGDAASPFGAVPVLLILAYAGIFWYGLNPWFAYEHVGDVVITGFQAIGWCLAHLLLSVILSIVIDGPAGPER